MTREVVGNGAGCQGEGGEVNGVCVRQTEGVAVDLIALGDERCRQRQRPPPRAVSREQGPRQPGLRIDLDSQLAGAVPEGEGARAVSI